MYCEFIINYIKKNKNLPYILDFFLSLKGFVLFFSNFSLKQFTLFKL